MASNVIQVTRTRSKTEVIEAQKAELAKLRQEKDQLTQAVAELTVLVHEVHVQQA